MSSNIKINRICQFCGKEFVAKTTVTKFCGLPCARRAGKLLAREKKVDLSNQETKAIKVKNLPVYYSGEYLKVFEAAQLLRSSKHTIYDLMDKGIIQGTNLGKRKTLIKRSEIDKLFIQEPSEPLIESEKPKSLKIKDCYTVTEAIQLSGMSDKALLEYFKRNKIQKTQLGKYVYIKKSDIEPLIFKQKL